MAVYLLDFSVSLFLGRFWKFLFHWIERTFFFLRKKPETKIKLAKHVPSSDWSERENVVIWTVCVGKLTWRHSVIDVMVTSPFDSLLWLANRIPNIIYASILHQLERRYHNLRNSYQLKSFAANFPWLRMAFPFLYHDFRRPLPYFLQLALHKNMSGSHMTKSKHFHWVKLVRGKTKSV